MSTPAASQINKGARPVSAAITPREYASLSSKVTAGEQFRCALLDFDPIKPSKDLRQARLGAEATAPPAEPTNKGRAKLTEACLSGRQPISNVAMLKASQDCPTAGHTHGDPALTSGQRPCPSRQCSEESSMCSVVTAHAERPSLNVPQPRTASADHASDVEMMSDVVHSTKPQPHVMKPPPPPRLATLPLEQISEACIANGEGSQMEQISDGVNGEPSRL